MFNYTNNLTFQGNAITGYTGNWGDQGVVQFLGSAGVPMTGLIVTGNTIGTVGSPNVGAPYYFTYTPAMSMSNETIVAPSVIQFVNVAGLTLSNIAKSGGGGTKSDFYFSGCSGTLSATALTSINSTKWGIDFESCAFDGVATSHLTNSSITHTASTYNGLYINASYGFTVSGSTMDHNGGTGLVLNGASHDIDITNNIITNNAGYGTDVLQGYNYNFLHNTVSGNGGDGMGNFNATPGTIHDIVYKYNLVTGNGNLTTTSEGDGISVDYDAYNITIAYNILANNTQTGIAGVGTSHGWIYNNVLYISRSFRY
jgi:hypothetical protein